MSDYKCDICGKKATVHITKFINGQKLKFHLCQACSEENQDKLKALIETQVVLKKKKTHHIENVVDDMLSGLKKAPKPLICPHCKSSFEDFEKSAKVPCEHCYDAFSRKFDEILLQMHLSTEHKGIALKGKKAKKKAPKAIEEKPQKEEDFKEIIEEASLEKLSADLDLAIAQERYEDAALLRDKIKFLKK